MSPGAKPNRGICANLDVPPARISIGIPIAPAAAGQRIGGALAWMHVARPDMPAQLSSGAMGRS
ncbi:MAG: hypothetical protein FWG10_13705 [Eubacteriaceae bacterium]|nr:hypothetical protein [Eubacteriaceae bacterium]